MWKKAAFIALFTFLLFGMNFLIYSIFPNNIFRYIMIGATFAAIILGSQTLSKKLFPKQ